ncbi:MAG: S-layer homology domain-containing protein, partial [Oscillospiraceae bacterium]|nr:S-layer homology domain-containing protein [Oscillospiraceae bacterium]
MKTRILSLALALVMAMTLAPAALAADSFSDVGPGVWYYEDVMTCAGLDVVEGSEDGAFRPDDDVTSVQFLAMLTRAFYSDWVETAKQNMPAGAAWSWPYTSAAETVGISADLAAIDGNPMRRYEMAVALYNILNENGYTAAHDVELAQKAADYKDISQNYIESAAACYHYGIISGIDGSFSGDQAMTRAQACTVMVRLLKLINGEVPSGPDNNQPQQPEQPGQTPGTLANGQPAAVENVVAILKEIELAYPTGTIWGNPTVVPDTNYYKDGPADAIDPTRDVSFVNRQIGTINNTNMRYACGGWACMVSELIFGKTGAPAREIYSVEDMRPGDIIFYIDESTNVLKHVAIVTGIQQIDDAWYFYTCDGNFGGKVAWDWP